MTNEDDVADEGGKNELWILVVDAARNNRSLSILLVVLSNDMIYSVCKLLLSAVVATVVFDNAFAFSPQPRLVRMRAQGTHLAMSEDPVSDVFVHQPSGTCSSPNQCSTIMFNSYSVHSRMMFSIRRSL